MSVAKFFEERFFEKPSLKTPIPGHQCNYVETGVIGISRCKICQKESRWLSVAVKGVSR